MDLASETSSHRLSARQANRSEVTLELSTHRYKHADLIDRLIVIKNGKLIATVPKKQVDRGRCNANQNGISDAERWSKYNRPHVALILSGSRCLVDHVSVVWLWAARVDEILRRGDARLFPLSKGRRL